jgi:ubiquinone/menaquinone biosynthesis C-methylase UbiE
MNKLLITLLCFLLCQGSNLQYIPEGSHVTFLDPNAEFKPFLDENLKKYPSLVVERFVLGQAENMDAFADDSIDVVLTSYVFCSVAGTAQAMSEIRRVLAPVLI